MSLAGRLTGNSAISAVLAVSRLNVALRGSDHRMRRMTALKLGLEELDRDI